MIKKFSSGFSSFDIDFCQASFMLQQVSALNSFLWLDNILSYGNIHVTFCFSIHQQMNTGIVCTFWLKWVFLLWTFLCESFYEHMFSVLLSIFLGVKLLGLMVTLCLSFWGIAKLLHSSCSILHSHQQWRRVLISSHSRQYLLLSSSLFTAILVGMKWWFQFAFSSWRMTLNILSCTFLAKIS